MLIKTTALFPGSKADVMAPADTFALALVLPVAISSENGIVQASTISFRGIRIHQSRERLSSSLVSLDGYGYAITSYPNLVCTAAGAGTYFIQLFRLQGFLKR